MMCDILRDKLAAVFKPVSLNIINESHLHQGHSGDDGSGESHFRIQMVSDVFTGMNRVARHRAVNEVIAEELATSIHAMALELHAPETPQL